MSLSGSDSKQDASTPIISLQLVFLLKGVLEQKQITVFDEEDMGFGKKPIQIPIVDYANLIDDLEKDPKNSLDITQMKYLKDRYVDLEVPIFSSVDASGLHRLIENEKIPFLNSIIVIDKRIYFEIRTIDVARLFNALAKITAMVMQSLEKNSQISTTARAYSKLSISTDGLRGDFDLSTNTPRFLGSSALSAAVSSATTPQHPHTGFGTPLPSADPFRGEVIGATSPTSPIPHPNATNDNSQSPPSQRKVSK